MLYSLIKLWLYFDPQVASREDKNVMTDWPEHFGPCKPLFIYLFIYQSSNSQTYFFNIWGKNLSNKGKQFKISTQWIKTEDNI